MILLPADLILTRSKSLLGKLIRAAEPGPSWANHVGIVTEHGLIPPAPHPPTMVEALWRVRMGSVWHFYGPLAGPKRPEVIIYRPYTLDSSTRSRIAAFAEGYVGRKYGWWKLLFHLTRLETLLFTKARVICHELAGLAYASQGLTFGTEPHKLNPDRIDDFCRTRPDKYQLVFGPGTLG